METQFPGSLGQSADCPATGSFEYRDSIPRIGRFDRVTEGGGRLNSRTREQRLDDRAAIQTNGTVETVADFGIERQV